MAIDARKTIGDLSVLLIIPRYCNRCGKHFSYRIEENELYQQKQGVEYICDNCLELEDSQTFRIVGSYSRLDEIYDSKAKAPRDVV